MSASLKRRRFIMLLGAGAAAFTVPRGGRAQPAKPMRRIGVILSGSEADPQMRARIEALRQGLATLGWIEGRNYRFELRWPTSDPLRVRTQAAELVALKPDVLVAGSQNAAFAFKRQTSTVPIVFVNLADPVGTGLVPSLASTGANVTGFTALEFRTSGKWAQLLREIEPRLTRAAFLFGGSDYGPTGEGFHRELAPAAATLGLGLVAIRITAAMTRADIEAAIGEFAAKPGGGLITAADPAGSLNRATIIALAARHRLPAVYPFRYFAEEGGLAVYGVDILDEYRRAAGYVDRLLKGAKAADLPVQAPDKFELIINLKTAKAQDIAIPPILLTRADDVIE
jgi:putative ABC transport system substrate-binding protein